MDLKVEYSITPLDNPLTLDNLEVWETISDLCIWEHGVKGMYISCSIKPRNTKTIDKRKRKMMLKRRAPYVWLLFESADSFELFSLMRLHFCRVSTEYKNQNQQIYFCIQIFFKLKRPMLISLKFLLKYLMYNRPNRQTAR